MNKGFIEESLEKMKGLKVLIIGDVMVDAYIWGKVSRISPEAPVPVVMQGRKEFRMGGAANVALNIKTLGAEPLMCSVIGNDDSGKLFKDIIRDLQITHEGLIESKDRITTTKTRIIAGQQQLLRVDQELDKFIDTDLENALWEKIQLLSSKHDIKAIIFQDYDKGVITPEIIHRTIAFANEKGIPTLVDPKRRNFSHYKNATLFKPNFKELIEGLNLDLQKSDSSRINEAARSLLQMNNFKMVLITLSEQGMLLSNGEDYRIIPARTHEVSDVSGAGDTVVAMSSLCLAIGMDPYSMAQLANLAAGKVVERIGVVPVYKEWLLD